MSKIVFLGDSITRGISYGGVTLPQTFAKLIGELNGYTYDDIINAGVNGDTSAQALERLPALLTEYSPVVVSVMIGINDYRAGLTPEESGTNIEAIIGLIRAAGATPVVMSSQFRRGTAAVVNEYREYLLKLDALTLRLGVRYMDFYRTMACQWFYNPTSWVKIFATNDITHLSVFGHEVVRNFSTREEFVGFFLPEFN